MSELDDALDKMCAGTWPRVSSDLAKRIRARIQTAEAEVKRLERGVIWAHYELAEKMEPDMLLLMDLLDGLLGGKTADEASKTARRRERVEEE